MLLIEDTREKRGFHLTQSWIKQMPALDVRFLKLDFADYTNEMYSKFVERKSKGDCYSSISGIKNFNRFRAELMRSQHTIVVVECPLSKIYAYMTARKFKLPKNIFAARLTELQNICPFVFCKNREEAAIYTLEYLNDI